MRATKTKSFDDGILTAGDATLFPTGDPTELADALNNIVPGGEKPVLIDNLVQEKPVLIDTLVQEKLVLIDDISRDKATVPQKPKKNPTPLAATGVRVSFPIPGAKTRHDPVGGVYAFPTAVEPSSEIGAATVAGTIEWAAAHASGLEQELSKTGALMFRGFPLRTSGDFSEFATALGYPSLSPVSEQGTAHAELVNNHYPHRVLFHCDDKTFEYENCVLMDGHRAYAKLKTLAPDFVNDLEQKGVRYARVMTLDDRRNSVIGKGWRKTYGVNGPKALTRSIEENGQGEILEWLDNASCEFPVRHFSAKMDAVLIDPADGSLPRDRKKYLHQVLAAHRGWTDEWNRPGSGVVFGDGTEISWEHVTMIARVFEEETVAVPWKFGDVVLINSTQVLHSRSASTKNAVVPRRALVKTLKSETRIGKQSAEQRDDGSTSHTTCAPGHAVASAARAGSSTRYQKVCKSAKKARGLRAARFAGTGAFAYAM